MNKTFLKEKQELNLNPFLHTIDSYSFNFLLPNQIKQQTYYKIGSKILRGYIHTLEPYIISNQSTLFFSERGIFSQQIFGPITDYICACKTFKLNILQKHESSLICPKCYTELTESRTRKYRMGYINFRIPILHPWYLKFTKLKDLISTYLFNIKYVTDFLTYNNYYKHNNISNIDFIFNKLKEINIFTQLKKLRLILDILTKSTLSKKYIACIRLLETFILSDLTFESLFISILPIEPPEFRSVNLDSTEVNLGFINSIYLKLLLINKHLDYKILNNTTFIKNTQELTLYINELFNYNISNFDNSFTSSEDSFTDWRILVNQDGFFKSNLLGKNVIFSGRAIITVDPFLEIRHCKLPYFLVLKLFKPLIDAYISKYSSVTQNVYLNINTIINKSLSSSCKYLNLLYWILCSKLLSFYSVILNRPPSLHQWSLHALDPLLSYSNTIVINPLICSSMNADFDGDQMSFYLPLLALSQLEIKKRMKILNNFVFFSNDNFVFQLSKEILLGLYYLTLMFNYYLESYTFLCTSVTHVFNLLFTQKIKLQSPIFIHYKYSYSLLKLSKTRKIYLLHKLINKRITLYVKEIFKTKNNFYILLTNIGILICYITHTKHCYIHECFIKTTPGRLLFSLHFS